MNLKNKVYFLGPSGSFCSNAARLFFSNDKKIKFNELSDISQILEQVTKEKNSFAVVPIENSAEGSLNIVLDNVVAKNLKIIGEIYLPVSHCLLSGEKTLAKIKKIYSHSKALEQVADWLKNNLPQAIINETKSTSAAASLVKQEPFSGAIANQSCAKLYKLNILAKQLEENPSNYTRFWVLSNKIKTDKTKNKISLFIILNDRVAALRDLLSIFAQAKINLTKIESRALSGQAWQYGFFIDFLNNQTEHGLKTVLQKIKNEVAYLQILGYYQNQQPQKQHVEYFINYLQNLFQDNKPFVKELFKKPKSNDLLITLLNLRLLLIPSVALYKYQNKISLSQIYQPKREKEIIKKRFLQAKKKKILPVELLMKLVKNNLALSRQLQKNIYQDLAQNKINSSQLNKISLTKLRQFLDQIDDQFDEALSELTPKEQKEKLANLLNFISSANI